MKIIFNADDFGYSNGINYGIIDAHQLGILTSTTLMVNMPGTIHAISLMKRYPKLSVGLHLNFSFGKSLTGGKSLGDATGKMVKPDLLSKDYVYIDEEVYLEIHAQYNQFVALVGKKPTHIDSHLFSTDKVDAVRRMAIRFCNEKQIPLRNHSINSYKDVRFINHRDFNSAPCLDYVIQNFESISGYDCVEIMCHPGYVDNYLLSNSSYTVQRAEEVSFLTSEETITFFKENNVVFTTYEEYC